MAIYHFNLVTVQGSKNQPIAKVLASMFGVISSISKINQACNFLNKRTGLLHNEIMLPFQTQDLISDRSKLWHFLEQNKYRKDAIYVKKQSVEWFNKIKNMVMWSPYLLSSVKSQKRFKVDKELN